MSENEQEYFEQMLDARFKNVDDKLTSILIQTTKTNGRVSNSEKDIQELKQWRAESRGHWKASTIIGSIVGFVISVIIAYVFKK